jgi:hypothetical protein
MRRGVLMALTASASFLARPGLAQSRSAEGEVRAVVDSFFTAVKTERWNDAVRWLDLTAFDGYLRERVRFARAALPAPEPTVEELMANSPSMPRAVAEWHVEQSRKMRANHSFDDYSYEFFGVRSFRALAALSVPQAAARWLEALDGRSTARETIQRDTCLRQVPLDSLMPPPSWELGLVAFADDSTSYAIYSEGRWREETIRDFDGVSRRVMALRRTSLGWRILAKRELLFTGVMYMSGCS